MRNKVIITYLLSLLIFFPPMLCIADNETVENSFEIVSDYTYRIDSDDSQKEYEPLCLFGAKFKAVALSAKYLTHLDVLKHYGKKQKEIFCLVTDELKVFVIENKVVDNGTSYYTKIRTKVRIKDFIKAEIKNDELEKEENAFSWQEEMGQYVYKSVDPGKELSRAYRYLRKKYWRIAIIYLDHLQQKYPNWQEIYFAKAIGLYAENKPVAIMKALKTSCSLGNKEACEDLKGFSKHRKGIQFE